MDIANGANFYQAREEKIAALLNDSSRGLSDEQKEYWQNMNSQVETPFQYGYYEGWLTQFLSRTFNRGIRLRSCFTLVYFLKVSGMTATDV